VKLLIDMNLAPLWAEVLQRHGWEAAHWSAVGDARASDRPIMEWSPANSYVVFTHDLDFGALLAATGSDGPSVIQVRTQDVTPEHLEGIVTRALRQHETLLEGSVLITIDEARARSRILPLRR